MRADALDGLRLAIDALSLRRLRSALGILGIVIGVAAVIAMLSIVEGARGELLEQIRRLGENTLVVRSRYDASAASRGEPGLRRLSIGDARLLSSVAGVVRVNAVTEFRFALAGSSSDGQTTVIADSGALALGSSARPPAAGRLLTALDSERRSRVCVIGSGLALSLFGGHRATGSLVRLGDDLFTVVGVFSRGGQAPGIDALRDLDGAVLVPFSTMSSLSRLHDGRAPADELWLTGSSPAVLERIAGDVSAALERDRGTQAGFEVIVPRRLLEQRLKARRTLDILLGCVGTVALLVGAIGIANVMATSVLERTAEIGLRRTVGATRRSIAIQFFTEGTLMSAVGACGGVVLGSVIAIGVGRSAGWPTAISFRAVLLAIAMALVTGIAAAAYPARLAASLQPIDAVRHE